MPPTFQTAQRLAPHRTAGEDRLLLREHGDGVVVLVADGAGGISGGAEAAALVVATVEVALADPAFDPWRAVSWTELLARADLLIADDHQAGETTAVVVAVSARGVVGASSGDSGAWIVQEHGHDDLTARQKRKPRLGSGEALSVPLKRPELEGTLLVASDGLLNYARATQLCELVCGPDLEVAASHLVEVVRLPSGELQDDVALGLVRRRR